MQMVHLSSSEVVLVCQELYCAFWDVVEQKSVGLDCMVIIGLLKAPLVLKHRKSQSLTLNVMIAGSQFVRNSQLYH